MVHDTQYDFFHGARIPGMIDNGGENTVLDKLERTVKASRRRALSWRDGWVPASWHDRAIEEVVASGTRLSELPTPLMTLDQELLDRNIESMQAWCDDREVLLAPHGKTTMSPYLWLKQLRAGAWGITVANESQLRVARQAGVPRIILANLLLRSTGLNWLSAQLDADENFDFFCWVDSIESVRIMDAALRKLEPRRRVDVLVEVGAPHARTGARGPAAALAVANEVKKTSTLALVGTAGFEAAITGGATPRDLADIDRFLHAMLEVHGGLANLYDTAEPIVTAGGSKFFDRVVEVLRPESDEGREGGTRLVLRSGGYLVHDDGRYRAVSPENRRAGPPLRSAMHVWSRVISIPEPGLALLDAGKRDVPYDAGLPEPQYLRRGEPSEPAELLPLPEGHTVVRLDDQHAYLQIPSRSPLKVGDVVRLGLSHPCTAFDKWPLIPTIDDSSSDEPRIVDLVETCF